VIPDLKINF